MEHIMGTITMLLATALATIALPSQILKNHRDKKVGITLWMTMLVLGVYTSRATYSLLIGSYYIMIPDIIGTISSSIILFQAAIRPQLAFIAYAEKRNWL